MSSEILNDSMLRDGWQFAALTGGLSVFVIVLAYVVGSAVNDDIGSASTYIGDPAWAPYQLGSEHARLLLASETGAAPETLQLRGNVFLSFVDRVKNTSSLRDAHGRLAEPAAALEGAFLATQRLLADVGTAAGREALRQRLRQDAPLVRDVTLALSKTYRKQAEADRVHRAEALGYYVSLLQVLHVALLGLFLLTILMAWKLIRAANDRERQHATEASILKAVEDGILGVGPAGTILYGNDRASALLGHRLEAGHPLPEPREADSELLVHLRSFIGEVGALKPPASILSRAVHTGCDGGIRHFTLSMAPAIEDVDMRSAASFVITIRDVTAEREAARQGAEYEARIADVSRVFSYAMITGGIVHEISQPLGAIRNYIHMLKTSPEAEAASSSHRMIVEHLAEEAERASEVIRNVRQMGPQDAKFDGSCRLSEAVQQSVRLISLGSNPPPPIRIRTSGAVNLQVKGSLPLMGQVIVNLLRNALQASASAGGAGAEIMLRKRGRYAEVSVADFGAGVGPEAAARLFVPFSKSSGDGMGLGLAISQRIASNLGGSVSWENRETGGALFKFNVPLANKG